jgi:hypothetical protein
MRLLVVSFLYDSAYYERIAREYAVKRFRFRVDMSPHIKVLEFYPGFVDPETLVARVRRKLQEARLEGRPYTVVILDGIHNIVVQFPLLEREPLLWPTLFRVFRVEGIDAISTFTFFKMAGLEELSFASRKGTTEARVNDEMVTVSQELFFHLLVGNCDYVLVAERPGTGARLVDSRYIQISVVNSIDDIDGRVSSRFWDPATYRYLPAGPERSGD